MSLDSDLKKNKYDTNSIGSSSKDVSLRYDNDDDSDEDPIEYLKSNPLIKSALEAVKNEPSALSKLNNLENVGLANLAFVFKNDKDWLEDID
jgi:hypothetical protein